MSWLSFFRAFTLLRRVRASRFVASCLCLAAGARVVAAEGRELYILSVGVDLDALYVRQALVAAESFYDQVHSRTVIAERATRAAALDGLDWLARKSTERDVAIIFLSTHGYMTPEKGLVLNLAATTGNNEGDPVLLGTELNTALGKIKGQPIVLIDACHSGALIGGNAQLPHTASLILACGSEELSAGQTEREDRPSGFFVIALCEALSGLADRDHDRTVTFKEVADYLPARAQAFYRRQSAVVVRQPGAESIPMARLNSAFTVQQLWTPRVWRNPFGLPDVHNPDGEDARNFAASVNLPGGAKDQNAAAWSGEAVSAAPDTIEGEWSGRWSKKTSANRWSAGTAQIKIMGDRVYILYKELNGRTHFIDAHRQGDTLVGRYVDLVARRDSTPWTGRIIDSERIDGAWGEGRWDFRRNIRR